MCSSRDEEDDRVYITPNGSDEIKILEAKFAKCLGGSLNDLPGYLDGPTMAIPAFHHFSSQETRSSSIILDCGEILHRAGFGAFWSKPSNFNRLHMYLIYLAHLLGNENDISRKLRICQGHVRFGVQVETQGRSCSVEITETMLWRWCTVYLWFVFDNTVVFNLYMYLRIAFDYIVL